MQLLTVEPRALLVQDAQGYLYVLRNELKQHAEQIAAEGFSEQQVLEWVVKESIERVYCLLTVNHDSRDWRYRRIFDQLSNQIDLHRFVSQYIQVPRLYGDCYVDLEIIGIDLFMWYFPHNRPPSNYSYQRKWN
jgi:hypothetical protein